MNRPIRSYKYLTVACAFALLLTLGGCAGNFKSHVSTKDVTTEDVKVAAKKGVIATIQLTADGRLTLIDSYGRTSEKIDPTKITDILPLLKDVGAITKFSNIALLETKSSPRRLKICIDGMCYCFEIKEHNGTATIGDCQ
jgi:hypothetical protein